MTGSPYRKARTTARGLRRVTWMCALLVALGPGLSVLLWLARSADLPAWVLFSVATLISATTVTAIAGRRVDRKLETLACTIERRLGAAGTNTHDAADSDSIARIGKGIDVAAACLDQLGHRATQRHAITGLPTRELLIASIQRRSEAASEDCLLAVIELADFDGLCAFDVALAERTLNSIAERIMRMVGSQRVVAHVDRARFAIWFDDTPSAQARTELDAICYALQDRMVFADLDMLPQIRSGFTVHDGGALVPEDLLARALASLAIRGHGAEPISAANPVVVARQSFNFEQDLRQAISRHQFELWFQPFIDAAENRICGAEALLRWRHPIHGLVSPSSFVPVVESAGLAEEIGLWTLNNGCREARAWEMSGMADVKVAVNLSAHQLERSDLHLLIKRTIDRHGLSASLLELELTETVAAVDPASANTLFKELRELGISISIDDFGAGYSSLSYLKRLSFDKLKIDREFVNHVDDHRDSQAICQSIIALGRGLGISVLAEGVERHEEFAWLRRHGCTLFQGYYFSPPLQASAFVDFARDGERIRQMCDLSPAALQGRLMASTI